LQIDGNTLRSYFKSFCEGGIDKLKEVNFYRPQSELQKYSGSLEAYFKANPPKSICEAAAKIKELTGIARKETRVRKFLKNLGFRHLKVGAVPAKALTEKKKRTTPVFGRRVGTPIEGGKRRETHCVFSGCGTFCMGSICRIFVVHDKNFYACALRSKSV
jgi:hypothetical protein